MNVSLCKTHVSMYMYIPKMHKLLKYEHVYRVKAPGEANLTIKTNYMKQDIPSVVIATLYCCIYKKD